MKFPVPARVKHKAITAGVVGGILFFIVAIILSVCAVKICNKRKRRKQEKGEWGEIIMPEVVCLTNKYILWNVVRISTFSRIVTIVYTDIHYLFSGGGFRVNSLLNKLTSQCACLCHIDDKEVHTHCISFWFVLSFLLFAVEC